MDADRYKAALELIAGLPRECLFFWTDRGGRLRERMTAADLARAILSNQLDLGDVKQERRDTPR
jgi:hypothetical protein